MDIYAIREGIYTSRFPLLCDTSILLFFRALTKDIMLYHCVVFPIRVSGWPPNQWWILNSSLAILWQLDFLLIQSFHHPRRRAVCEM
jgi:hypothetical protein